MNKTAILERIEKNVIRIIGTLPSRDIGSGIIEHALEVLITVEGGTQVNDQRFHVIDEGLPTESASFMNGREVKNLELQPPTREQKLLAALNELEKRGKVRGVDLSQLGITFAELEVAGIRIFVTELCGQLKEIESV